MRGERDLIMLKLAAGRERDLADIESLGMTREDADIRAEFGSQCCLIF